MIDLKLIRENPQKFDDAMKSRGNSLRSEKILYLDEQNRQKIFSIQELQAKRNKIAQEIAIVKKNQGEASNLLNESKKINSE